GDKRTPVRNALGPETEKGSDGGHERRVELPPADRLQKLVLPVLLFRIDAEGKFAAGDLGQKRDAFGVSGGDAGQGQFAKFPDDADVQVRLFLQFPHDGFLRRFAGLDAASRQAPVNFVDGQVMMFGQQDAAVFDDERLGSRSDVHGRVRSPYSAGTSVTPAMVPICSMTGAIFFACRLTEMEMSTGG